VLFKWEPDKIMDQLLPGTPHKQEYLDIIHSPFWLIEIDKGSFSASELQKILFDKVNQNPHKLNELNKFISEFAHYLAPMPQNIELFKKLFKNGYPLYILSNFAAESFNKLHQKNSFLNLANGMVISGKVNMVKPEIHIYKHLLKKHQLYPQECLFIDDKKENIDACQKAGIHGIIFQNTPQLKEELSKLNIQI
jgi:putative hydrolase of the HAD superfamily